MGSLNVLKEVLFPIFESSNLGKKKSEQVTYLILTSSESVKSEADRD